MTASWLVLTGWVLLGQASSDGAIGGVVVDAADGAAVPGAEVVLRARMGAHFLPVAKTTADEKGMFHFYELPIGPEYLYLPGANCDGIHYPGPRVRLTPDFRVAGIELSVCRSVEGPCPLVVRRHEIVLAPHDGTLAVSETIVVDNPTQTCFVGRPEKKGEEPVTLGLAIPSDFERVTFEEEFYGRRFSVGDGKIVTGVPWTPGEKELRFTYVLPFEKAHRVWERPMDLPCERVRVTVQTEKPDEVECNLTAAAANGDTPGELVFVSDETLPAGHVVRIELGSLGVPWMAYAPWAAVALLVGAVAVASVRMVRRGKRDAGAPAGDSTPGRAVPPPHGQKRKRRAKRRGRRQHV